MISDLFEAGLMFFHGFAMRFNSLFLEERVISLDGKLKWGVVAGISDKLLGWDWLVSGNGLWFFMGGFTFFLSVWDKLFGVGVGVGMGVEMVFAANFL